MRFFRMRGQKKRRAPDATATASVGVHGFLAASRGAASSASGGHHAFVCQLGGGVARRRSAVRDALAMHGFDFAMCCSGLDSKSSHLLWPWLLFASVAVRGSRAAA